MPVGFWEIVVVLVLALVLFGPNRLPEMGRALGKAIREFRKYTSELGTEFEKARRDIEHGASAAMEDGRGQGKEPGSAKPEDEKQEPPGVAPENR